MGFVFVSQAEGEALPHHHLSALSRTYRTCMPATAGSALAATSLALLALPTTENWRAALLRLPALR